MSILCHVNIHSEWGAGDYSPSLAGSDGCSAVLYNLIFLPGAEPDLASKEWVWTVSGLWLHSVQRHRFTLRASACARTNSSCETAGRAKIYFTVCDCVWMKCHENKCVCSLSSAVCEPSCGLYGTCVEPNKCQCKEGWHGRHCNKSKWETNSESCIWGVTHPVLYRNDSLKCLSSIINDTTLLFL